MLFPTLHRRILFYFNVLSNLTNVFIYVYHRFANGNFLLINKRGKI